ncbi:hypothetical protein WICANDRAFT_98034, partial [Wickerhamomyces anomalus NRRL Y-366-8]
KYATKTKTVSQIHDFGIFEKKNQNAIEKSFWQLSMAIGLLGKFLCFFQKVLN